MEEGGREGLGKKRRKMGRVGIWEGIEEKIDQSRGREERERERKKSIRGMGREDRSEEKSIV